MWSKKDPLLFRSQESVIEFADLFHFLFPRLIVIQPALDHLALLGTDTELTIAASGVGDGENQHLMALSCPAAGAALAMEDVAFQQRSAQYLLRGRQGSGDLTALADDL